MVKFDDFLSSSYIWPDCVQTLVNRYINLYGKCKKILL